MPPEQRRVVAKAQPTIGIGFTELAHGLPAIALESGGHHMAQVLPEIAAATLLDQRLKRQPLHPHRHARHGGELMHRLGIGTQSPAADGLLLGIAAAIAAGSQQKAGGQAHHVPLIGAWVCFIEIVDVKQQLALRRTEKPEI